MWLSDDGSLTEFGGDWAAMILRVSKRARTSASTSVFAGTHPARNAQHVAALHPNGKAGRYADVYLFTRDEGTWVFYWMRG